jgi:hypothetical protein
MDSTNLALDEMERRTDLLTQKLQAILEPPKDQKDDKDQDKTNKSTTD